MLASAVIASMRRASLLACFACGSLASTSCAGSMPASLRHPLVGAQAPSVPDAGTQGPEVGIWHGGQVKATVVDFWASWCAGCQESLPALDAIYRDKRDEGLRVVGVSVDQRRDDAFAMAASLHASFPIVVDDGARLLSQFHVSQVPLTFVIDREGTVRWIGRDTGDLRRAVDVVLAE
jgi:cytochrome c biogenesis protein CcmG/thiol:disulfide interchange protein DsbE